VIPARMNGTTIIGDISFIIGGAAILSPQN